MTRQLAWGWTVITRQACLTHGSLQPYHAPEAQPYHGDSGDAGQDHEDSAKPPRGGLHPGPGQRTPQSEATSPSALGSGPSGLGTRRLGRCWHERMAHDRVAAGPAAALQAPNSATSQQEGAHPSQPHGPTAARGDGVPAPGAILVRTPRGRAGDSGISGVGRGHRQAGRARRGRAAVGGRRSPGPGPGRRARPQCRWPVRSRR